MWSDTLFENRDFSCLPGFLIDLALRAEMFYFASFPLKSSKIEMLCIGSSWNSALFRPFLPFTNLFFHEKSFFVLSKEKSKC